MTENTHFVAPVTFVVSSDALLLNESVAALVKQALTTGLEAFNLDRFDAGEHGLEAVLRACSQLPVMAPRRVVICSRAHKMTATEGKELLAYLANPNEKTALILSAERLDQRTKVAAALSRAKAVLRHEPPRPAAMLAWARARAQQMGTLLEHDAAHALLTRVGPEPAAVVQALEKLRAMAGATNTLTRLMVEEGIQTTQAAQIFALSNALYARPSAELIGLINKLLEEGQSPLGMLSLMAREVRLLLGAATFEGNSFALASHLGVRDFVAERLMSRAHERSVDIFSSDLEALGRLEAQLKLHPRLASLLFSQLAQRFAAEPRSTP